MKRRGRNIVLALLACGVLGELIARGPYRALHGRSGSSQDLTVHYAAARVWLEGGNPYDMDLVAQAFVRGGGPRESAPTARSMPSVYPSVTHVVEAPLALVRWRTAVVLMQIVTLAAVALALLALAARVGLVGRKRALFFVLALALAPLQTGLADAQVAIPSAALLVLGWSIMSDRPVLSGILVALGAALKPPLAVPIAIVALARPDRRWSFTAGACFLVLFGIGELRLGGEGIAAWLRALSLAAAPGGMNSPGIENVDSITLVNLEMLFLRVAPLVPVAKACGIASALALGSFAFWRLRADPSPAAEIYAVSLLCVAGLLGMYHRVYDVVVLWIPLAAFVRDWNHLKRPARALGLALFTAFLVPGPTALQVLASSGRLPAAVTVSTLWRVLLIPHQVWLLLLFGLVLAYSIAVTCRTMRTDVESKLSTPGADLG